MNALPWDAEFECVINGVTVQALGTLRDQYANVPEENVRESLLGLLSGDGN